MMRRTFFRPAALAVPGSLSRNGVFVLGQSLIVTACLFLAYRLVIAHAGLERFGVWSLLLAGTALARVGDISGGGALARFLAAAERRGDSCHSRDLVHTVILTSLALNAALGLAVWIAAPSALQLFVAPEYLAEAHTLVPYVIASMVLGALAVTVTSGIDGAQRADRRALVVAVASLVFLVACALLVPHHGVVGFGAAQVLQQATMLLLGWLALRRHVSGLGWFPHRWRLAAFTETTSYALKLNAIGVMALMFEPLAKFAFNHAGGPGSVALYELASRLITQLRGLVIAAATPLVPAFAARPNPGDAAFQQMLGKATRGAILAADGTTFLTLVAAPLMSLAVIGTLSSDLLTLTAALTAGWSINIIVVPIYLAGQAFDLQRWNFASHTVIAIFVLIGIFVLAPVFGAIGLIATIVLGLIASMLTVLFGNSYAMNIMILVRRLGWAIINSSIIIVLSCLAAKSLFTLLT
jgi:O-antigen/teichoic acid export membrane protein